MSKQTNDVTDRLFVSEWTPCSREWFNDLAKFRSKQGKSPITDAILEADTGDSSLLFNLAQQCRKFETEHAALVMVAGAARKWIGAINFPDHKNDVRHHRELTEEMLTNLDAIQKGKS